MSDHSHGQIPDEMRDVKSFAIVGVSEKKTKFGAVSFRELKKRGYTVYPVHPTIEEFEGNRCYHSLADLPQPPDCVLVSVAPEKSKQVVCEAIDRGVSRIWLQWGADFSEARKLAESAGLKVTSNQCLLMYAEPVKGIHRLHRFIWKAIGKY
jgi:predicted CoA-binding protein